MAHDVTFGLALYTGQHVSLRFVRSIETRSRWRAVHIVLRLVFPDEDLDRQPERIDLVGRRLLQRL